MLDIIQNLLIAIKHYSTIILDECWDIAINEFPLPIKVVGIILFIALIYFERSKKHKREVKILLFNTSPIRMTFFLLILFLLVSSTLIGLYKSVDAIQTIASQHSKTFAK